MMNYTAECERKKAEGKKAEYEYLGVARGSYIGNADPMVMMFRQNPEMCAANRVTIEAWESHEGRK